jgi:hypothetical protein
VGNHRCFFYARKAVVSSTLSIDNSHSSIDAYGRCHLMNTLQCLQKISIVALTAILTTSGVSAQEPAVESTTDQVGRTREDAIVTPVNQLLTPYGNQVELAGLRP